jgi:hypothetical protein
VEAHVAPLQKEGKIPQTCTDENLGKVETYFHSSSTVFRAVGRDSLCQVADNVEVPPAVDNYRTINQQLVGAR